MSFLCIGKLLFSWAQNRRQMNSLYDKTSDMKYILLLLSIACTQKYADYDLIRKVDFQKETYERPITVMQVIPVSHDELKSCFNQWLFFSNADKQKNEAIPFMVRSLCPGKDYLTDTKMTETWWTTILFTRSCIEMETRCASLKK